MPVNFISAQTEYFPDDLQFQPFMANALEPKLGFLFELGKNELRLDIGNSLDIVKWGSEEAAYSIGADLFTYTLLRGETNFHFPVHAVDYLFGLNFAYKRKVGENEVGARLRLSHISAHLVDGHYDWQNDLWLDGHKPRVYSREFLELMPYYKLSDLRVYLGLTYIYHVDPVYIGKGNYQVGFDYIARDFISQGISLFAGYDLKLIIISKFSGNNSVVGGIKFGKYEGKGFSIYFQYYSGNSIHGEFFDFKTDYSALGLNLDL